LVAVHVRALCHERLDVGELAYSVESSLAGATGGRISPWWVVGLEVAVDDGCFLAAVPGGEPASRRSDHQPRVVPMAYLVEPDNGVATDSGRIGAAQGDGGEGKVGQGQALGEAIPYASG
jgi:hypothetical protein